MYSYNFTQWLLIFYLYSFVGWVWESCYVSLKKARWVNRGFLNGPFLPIYGFGALTILLSTLAVRENLPLIFLFGMAAASVLEYFTGVGMEKIFHVRYWDYSNQKFNLNGHICLTSSLAWGFFSVLLVRVIHPPVETAVLSIPATTAEVVTVVLSILVAGDVTQSFHEALDLKETLIRLSESNEHIRRLQKRLEVASAFAELDYEEQQKKFREKLAGKGEFLRNLEEYRQMQQQRLRELAQKLAQSVEAGKQKTEELSSLQEMLVKELQELGSRTNRKYRNAARQLRRNPGMISEKYGDALKDIREIMRRKNTKKD